MDKNRDLNQMIPSARNTVRFILDGKLIEVTNASPSMTVLEYLRERLGRTGTKEGCAEGDCGACTVVLGFLAEDGGHINYRAINSCIRFLPTIDSHELITIESLKADDQSLHPVQQAMVDHHASQCGFCTPGFVMSLFAYYLNSVSAQREEVVTTLAGNLCRCTGYRPIIEAGCNMNGYPEPTKWSRADSQSAIRIEMLRKLDSAESLALDSFYAPRTLKELSEILRTLPSYQFLAGGTDIGLWVTKQLRSLKPIVYLGNVAELQQIRTRDSWLEIGAALSLRDAWPAISAIYPQSQDLALRFASPLVCNSGTLCGNIANGSPVGDSMPLLIALNAQLKIYRDGKTRQLPLDEFYLGYQSNDLQTGEIISSVMIPQPQPHQYIASYKVSKRYDQDIASVCAAFCVERHGNRVVMARIAFGGMAAIPKRAYATEIAIVGQELNGDSVAAAIAALAQDFQPLSDQRASSSYRMLIAANLIKRFYLESTSAGIPQNTDVSIGA